MKHRRGKKKKRGGTENLKKLKNREGGNEEGGSEQGNKTSS
jgi:hypothetical protein